MLGRALRAIARRTGATWSIKVLYAHVDIPRRLRIGDRVVRVPTILGMRCGFTEPWMVDLLDLVMARRAGTFVDVGANLGQTFVKVRAVDPNRRYVGFEPNPACVFYLRELIRLNRFVDCTIVPIALHDDDRLATLDLFSPDRDNVAASIAGHRHPLKPVHDQMLVPAYSLETISKAVDLDDAAIVKIDVEGSELEVVRTLRPVIARRRPVILLEVLPAYHEGNEPRVSRQRSLEEEFAAHGYVLFRVAKNRSDRLSGLRHVDQIGIHSDMSMCDYVVVPSEGADQFASSLSSSLRSDVGR